ncbi:hypothetical protein HS125_19810 [bacterium]|nr:hypothetical protein [bacterium]
MRRLIAVAACFALIFTMRGNAAMPPEAFQMLPRPKEVVLTGGAGLSYGGLRGLVLVDCRRPVLPPLLDFLPLLEESGRGVLTLRLAADAELPASTEGYALTVREGRAEIASRGQAGLFYGCRTLAQLLEDARDTGTAIPALAIRDWPMLEYRAVHIDTKHHLDTLRYNYDLIDRLAAIKINAIIWEFEDKLATGCVRW